MRVVCHQCQAANAIQESDLEDGGLRTRCVRCGTMMVVDASGHSHPDDHDSRVSQQRALVPSAPVEELATMPLPPLGELALKPPDRSARPARSDGPPPPRAGSIADIDLDNDAEPGAPAPPAAALPSTLPPSARGGSSSVPRYTVSVPLPPVTRHGWLLLAGLTLLGLLTGAVFFGGSEAGDSPFDEVAGRAAFRQASRSAAACFDGEPPTLTGVLAVRFEPSGDASQVTVEGDLAKSERLDCVRERYEDTQVPAFRGPPVVLRQRLALGASR